MRKEKKTIVDSVMDKEPFKLAQEILLRFAPYLLPKSQVSWN
jgi:hypothetical protein